MTTVLVAGATGGIGAAIVRALLERDDVRAIATSRSAERLSDLRATIAADRRGRLTTIVGNAGDFDGAQAIARSVEAGGGIDVAVASLGRGFWSSGPTIALEPHAWRTMLDEMLTSHFAFAWAIVPVLALRAGSRFLSIGGGAAFAPMPDAGLISVAAAGQAMLTRVLAAERGHDPPHISELIIDGPVNTPESRAIAGETWIRDDEVGSVAADLILTGATRWQPTTTNGPLVIMGERS